jgi:hypothetical protein
MHSVKKPEPERQSSLMEPVFFEALFFDARDGRLRGTLQWQARRDAGQFLPLHDGGFLVHVGDKIMRYSSDLKPVRERDLIPPAEADEKRSYLRREWKLDVVPGGRIASLRLYEPPEGTDFWVSTDSLENLSSAKMGSRIEAVAEDARAIAKYSSGPELSFRVFLWENGNELKEIAERYRPETFLADGALLLYKSRPTKDFKVVDRKGSVLFGGPLAYADPSALQVKRNVDGTRFAINDTHRAIPIIQKRDFFDWNFEVKVGDVDQRKMVAEISLGTHDARQIDLALSPDGSRLAVLAESTLTLYRLPSIGSPTEKR